MCRFFGVIAAITSATLLIGAAAIAAESASVAPGVQVTKKTFSAPINEQPFFGFTDKTAELKAVDEKFINTVVQAAGSRDKAFDAAIDRGWQLLSSGNLPEATRRFNQAFLLSPDQSAVYHSFAIIAAARFNDSDYADELFKIARTRPSPMKTLNADYGRMLLVSQRPQDAVKILQQAVLDAPGFPTAWSNLAWAHLQIGDRPAACAAAGEAGKLKVTPDIASDLTLIRQNAQCQ